MELGDSSGKTSLKFFCRCSEDFAQGVFVCQVLTGGTNPAGCVVWLHQPSCTQGSPPGQSLRCQGLCPALMPGFGPVLEELPADVVPRAPCSGCPASNKS